MSLINFDYIFGHIVALFTAHFWVELPGRVFALADILRPYSTILSLLFVTGIVYCFLRIEQITEATKHHDLVPEGVGQSAKGAMGETSPIGARWEKIERHLDSGRESDWRLAIIEADVLLDEMMTTMGYRADSLGEKLKGVEKSDFTTIAQAWEAHTVRNKIAHEGAAFALSEREARRVIALYEEVFREFRFL